MTYPANQFHKRFPEMIRELRLLGEACWPAFYDSEGAMVLGYLSPFQIDAVITDPENTLVAIGVETKKDMKGNCRKYKVIQDRRAVSKAGQKVMEGFADGECFYFAVNKPLYVSRGRSVLLRVMDELDYFRKTARIEAQSWARKRAVLWEVLLKGLTQNEVAERAKTLAPPHGLSMRAHNESEEWKTLSPKMDASDYSQYSRTSIVYILGCYGIPEHWFANGGDTNRSTADAMAEPTKKMLTCLQEEISHILMILAQRAVSGKAPGKKPVELMCVWPPIANSDMGKISAGFIGTVNGARLAVDDGFMTEETAVRLIAASAKSYGIEIEPKAELENARQEKADRQSQDSFEFKK